MKQRVHAKLGNFENNKGNLSGEIRQRSHMKPQTIIQGLVAFTVLGIAAAAVIFCPQSQTVNVPFSETWTVKEVVNGTTLNVTMGFPVKHNFRE